jgi:hypothetical protein
LTKAEHCQAVKKRKIKAGASNAQAVGMISLDNKARSALEEQHING